MHYRRYDRRLHDQRVGTENDVVAVITKGQFKRDRQWETTIVAETLPGGGIIDRGGIPYDADQYFVKEQRASRSSNKQTKSEQIQEELRESGRIDRLQSKIDQRGGDE